MNALKSILGGQKNKKSSPEGIYIFSRLQDARTVFKLQIWETCKRAFCDFLFLCQETFAKSKDLLKKKFFNLSGSENLKKQGSEKEFFARLDCWKHGDTKTYTNSLTTAITKVLLRA